MAITPDQLEILRDTFAECDDDWLLRHVSIELDAGPRGYGRDVVIRIDDFDDQDFRELQAASSGGSGS